MAMLPGLCAQSSPAGQWRKTDAVPRGAGAAFGANRRLEEENGAPLGTRTPVFAVRGRRPGPLDEGSLAKRPRDSLDPGPMQAREKSTDRNNCRASRLPLMPPTRANG